MAILQMDSFQKTVLASLIGLCVSQSAFALQEISDEGLSQTIGEGIALLPQNTYMIFQGEKATTTSADLLNRQLDTGYINYVPVGPLSLTATDTNKSGGVDAGDRAVGKADLFLYGLAVSASNSARTTNNNERVGLNATGNAINAISSWGTASNPWLLKVQSEANIPTFTPDVITSNGTTLNTDTGVVTYMALEAPLYEYYNDNTSATGAPTVIKTGADPVGASAYNLKLGLWADAFVRNPNKTDGASDQFQYGNSVGQVGTDIDANRANRLRLQGIWNGFSLNGSNLKVFQTLNGAGNTGGLSPFYNNTLGLSGVFRFNSGDGSNLKAGMTMNAPTSTKTDTLPTLPAGQTCTACGSGSDIWTARYSPDQTSNPGSTGVVQYRIRSQTTKITSTGNWTAPTGLNDRVLRLSTRETTDTNNLATPAIQGGSAPTFDANEGIFIYNLNTNLVLGNLYQPVILGSDGKNFSLEVARIPNKESIYKKIYTDYSGLDQSYKGSTCNVYQCGSNISLGGKTYQGSNATHSSISIGTVYSDDAGKTLQAFKGNSTQDAVGISFGSLSTGAVSKDQYFYQLQNQQRTSVSCSGLFCSGYRWQYRTSSGSTTGSNGDYGLRFDSTNGVNWVDIDSTSLYNPTTANTGYTRQDNGNTNSKFVVPTTAGALPNARFEDGKWYTTKPNADINTYKLNTASPMNNMGSAVIDGVLIQHLKITTTGL
ncbi:hypothetical protein [Acinetobacter gyllenbergii]|uniref:hypothetical protein n=1 Tax=Acinetobacter gyllenbergii TaxID=134534 RepID=UPI000806C1DB|nr:hypothetical protein [Acinetobacter gyllenbergii]OBY73655.1 signal peptide protein [Acinetobacter gyllenbergii]